MIALIDIGGTHIKYGVLNEDTEEMSDLGKVDTDTSQPNFNMMNRLLPLIEMMKRSYELNGVAISSAAVIEPVRGEVLHANPNIPNYTGSKIKAEIEREFSLPCSVENDVNCALLGELYFGEKEDIQNALMLTIGTGVGGSLFINGNLFHGHSFSAGEIGYSYHGENNIETVASARAFINNVSLRLNRADIDGHWIFEKARAGHSVCIEEIDRFIDRLVKIIINSVSLINPEVVLLGGGIMEQKEYLSEKIHQRFELYQNHYVRPKTKIRFATLGNKAGMLGAYVHYKNQH